MYGYCVIIIVRCVRRKTRTPRDGGRRIVTNNGATGGLAASTCRYRETFRSPHTVCVTRYRVVQGGPRGKRVLCFGKVDETRRYRDGPLTRLRADPVRNDPVRVVQMAIVAIPSRRFECPTTGVSHPTQIFYRNGSVCEVLTTPPEGSLGSGGR